MVGYKCEVTVSGSSTVVIEGHIIISIIRLMQVGHIIIISVPSYATIIPQKMCNTTNTSALGHLQLYTAKRLFFSSFSSFRENAVKVFLQET